MKPDRFSSFDAIVHGHNNGLFILSTAKQIRTAHWHSARISLLSLSLLFVRSPTLAICAKHIMPRHTQKNRMEQTQKIPVFFCSSDSISAEYTERKHMDAVWNEAFTRSLFGIVRDFVGFVCVFCFGKRAFTKHFRLRNCWKTLNQWKNNGQTGFKHTQHTNK